MGVIICGIRDEEIVDYIQGNLSEIHSRKLERHLKACRMCNERYRQWREMLGENVSVAQPSEAVKRQLMRKAAVRLSLRSIARTLHPKRMVMLSAAVLLLIMAIGLFRSSDVPESSDIMSAQPGKPAHFILNSGWEPYKPDRQHYIYANCTNPLNGYIWMNGQSKEILVIIEGVEKQEQIVLQLR